VYNVVMPEVIFEAVDKNMERGIPPLVPQYAASGRYMFNGSVEDPCTGLEFSTGVGASYSDRKVIAGVTNTFNCDLVGRASYWPFERNPPEAWVDTFVARVEEMGQQKQPLPLGDKRHLALSHARCIPVALDVGDDAPRAFVYRKLTELEKYGSGAVSKVTIQECTESGEEIVTVNPTTASSGESSGGEEEVAESADGEDEMVECGGCETALGPDEGSTCDSCEVALCNDCAAQCQACTGYFCEDCLPSHAGCSVCDCCHQTVRSPSLGRCEDCGRESLCGDCVLVEEHLCDDEEEG
jgi:hypothetical protein